jgi:NAD-dependent dihydropyrimidine dehydrogenase PreA subunit
MPGDAPTAVTSPVVIDATLCKACGICIGLCPQAVLTAKHDGVAETEHPDACTACRICELHCPDFAVSVRVPAKPRSARTRVGAS